MFSVGLICCVCSLLFADRLDLEGARSARDSFVAHRFWRSLYVDSSHLAQEGQSSAGERDWAQSELPVSSLANSLF